MKAKNGFPSKNEKIMATHCEPELWQPPKYMFVFPKIGKHPKMDGENNGKPYFLMDDLGVTPFLETSICLYD